MPLRLLLGLGDVSVADSVTLDLSVKSETEPDLLASVSESAADDFVRLFD